MVIVILSIILAIGIGISGTLVKQLSEMQVVENSVIAFYGATTSIEMTLLNREDPEYQEGEIIYGPDDPVNFFTQECTQEGYDYCITGTGIYRHSRRSLRVRY